MGKRVDCRGLACPQPVLEAKKALEESDEVLVLVDNPSSKENVKRFAESQGHQVSVTEGKGVFELTIQKGQGKEKPDSVAVISQEIRCATSSDMVVFIDTESLGRGSEELGKILMRSFMHTLGESGVLPQKIILMNSGVKLPCEGSEVLGDLQALAEKGVEILACGTCLDYFGIKTKLRVGKVSNMYEILNSLAGAGRVIKV